MGDVVQRRQALEVLMSYNPFWLRLAVEVVTQRPVQLQGVLRHSMWRYKQAGRRNSSTNRKQSCVFRAEGLASKVGQEALFICTATPCISSTRVAVSPMLYNPLLSGFADLRVDVNFVPEQAQMLLHRARVVRAVWLARPSLRR